MKKMLVVLVVVFLVTACGSSVTAEQLEAKDKEIETLKNELDKVNSQLKVSLDDARKSKELVSEMQEKYKPYEELSKLEFENKKKKEENEKEAQELAEKAAQEERARQTEEEKAAREAAQEEEEAKGYETGITYEQLARNPKDYMLKKVMFSGKVLQVTEGSDITVIRLAVDGDYNSVLYLTLSKILIDNNRILEDDYITIYGFSTGLETYKATSGASISIPGVIVDRFEY